MDSSNTGLPFNHGLGLPHDQSSLYEHNPLYEQSKPSAFSQVQLNTDEFGGRNTPKAAIDLSEESLFSHSKLDRSNATFRASAKSPDRQQGANGSSRIIRGTNRRNIIDTSQRPGRFSIFARGGNDLLTIRSRTEAYGEAGNDIINAAKGIGKNILDGGRGNDVLYGGIRDRLLGDAGNDQLWAGPGRDTLTGGTGTDRFGIADGKLPNTPSTITDFNRKQDKIVIRNVPGVFDFDDLTLVRAGRHTRVQVDGRTIATLLDVRANQLKRQHFIIQSLTPPTITTALSSDTGASSNDLITRESGLSGQVSGAQITDFAISTNGGTFNDITGLLNSAGQFTLSRSQLEAFNGSPLTDGSHTFQLRATNAQQQVVTQTITFTLDTTSGKVNAVNVANIANSGGSTHTFTVDYSDNNAIDITSLGNGDVRVTGPGNFSQAATLVGITPNSNGTPRTATYQITAPGGTWNSADNGTYTLALAANQVTDMAGNTHAAQPTLKRFSVNIPSSSTGDITPGSAKATAANVATATSAPTTYNFTVTYSDNTAIDVGSLGTGDVRVTGPNGFNQIASFVGVNASGNGTPRIATYQITVPGTNWNTYDNGIYTLSLLAGQVQDTAGNAIAPGTIGNFTVNIPFTRQRINFQPNQAPVPTGYTLDFGQGFTDARGYGWVNQGSSTPLNITSRVFDRNATLGGAAVDQRLDTVALMQNGTPAAWEFALANGRYSITASVGDTAGSSNHLLRAEGLTLVPAFTASGPQTFKLATRTVEVTDGRLTLDAIGGTDTRINFVEINPIAPGLHPSVVSSTFDNATNVDRRAAINLSDLSLVAAGQGVDAATLTSATVQLYRTRDNTPVLSNMNTSGGADTIVVQPVAPLDADTQYTLRITDGVRDLGGRSFLPYSLTFTTGTELSQPPGEVNFNQSVVFSGAPLASLVMSPDNQFLYATALDGRLRRWQVQADGSLTGLQTFSGLVGNSSSPRELVGIAFDPTNPNVIWVAQNTRTGSDEAEDFTSKIVKVTLTGGPGFTATVQDYVVGLPRSGRDHFSNSLRFGPDGNLYLSQGSNTSAGVADIPWGLRPERLLSAALLQINPNLTPPVGGFNVQTEDYTTAGGTVIPGNYDPFAPNAPVRLYATGLRNVYDFLFHSNGSLYAPANGSGGGGITPDNPNTPENEGLTSVSSRPDYLFRVQQGRYYGHPNPSRNEYIMAGGNPTAGTDPDEVTGTPGTSGYAVGTLPDPDYTPALLNLGVSRAPTGVIEYQSNSFGGRLRNRILFTEFSAGDDIVVVDLDASGNVISSSILAGGTVNPDWGMANPVDLVENTANGNIYVAELYTNSTPGQIRLLRPA